jgi:hypothetical protein
MKKNNQKKTSMDNAMGPFRDAWLSGPRTVVYRLNAPLIGPVLEDQDENMKLHYCLYTATIDHSEVTFFNIIIR